MMEQDVEVALRITEAIMEKTTGSIEKTTGLISGDAIVAQTYVRLFSAVHVRVKAYFSPDIADNGHPSYFSRSSRENGHGNRVETNFSDARRPTY